jgi:FkbM family methyltransferase
MFKPNRRTTTRRLKDANASTSTSFFSFSKKPSQVKFAALLLVSFGALINYKMLIGWEVFSQPRVQDATSDNSIICDSSTFSPPEVPLFIKWEHFMPKTRDLFFIQIGANVGKNVGSGDPIWEYVRPCNWSGVAVELVPDTFLKLKTNYVDMEASKRVVTLNYGVSDKPGYAKISGHGETASIGSAVVADKEQVERDGLVEIVTITGLWDRIKDHIPSSGVDILVLDVEGNEGNILARENLPFPRPTRVLFEIAHLSVREKDEIDENLRSQGYRQSADLIHRDRLGLTMPPQDRLYELIVD